MVVLGLEVTERHLEFDVALERARAQIAILAGKTQPQHMPVGAQLWNGWGLVSDPDLQQLVGLATKLLLVASGLGLRM